MCQRIIPTVAALAGMVDTSANATDTGDSITMAPMVGGSIDGTKKRDKHMLGRNTASPQEQIPDFEVMIKDIDDAINTESVTSILNTHSPDSLQLLAGNDQYVEINGGTTEVLGNQEGNLEKVEAKLTSQLTRLSPTKVKFEMGWAEKHIEGKGSKSGPKICCGKSKSKLKQSNGPAEGIEGPCDVTKRGPSKRVWTRICTGPPIQDEMDCKEVGKDPKRKHDEFTTNLSEVTCMEKKQRLTEETESLSIHLATQLGSAEVAEQLRRVQ